MIVAAIVFQSLVVDSATQVQARHVVAARGELAEAPIFEITVAPDELPTGNKSILFYQATLNPGAELSFLAGPFCGCGPAGAYPGVGAEVVQTGEYTLKLDQPIIVTRAGTAGGSNEPETILPGVEVTLKPGDVATYMKYDATGIIRNAGQDSVVVIGAAIIGVEPSTTAVAPPTGVSVRELSRASQYDWDKLPTGKKTLALRRVTLPVGATIPAYDLVGLEAIYIVAGEVGVQYFRKDETAPAGAAMPRGAEMTVPFNLVAPGSRRAITNSGDTRADLLVFTVAPVMDESA
jgi:hypothetical protein